MQRKRRDEIDMEEMGRTRSRSPRPAGAGSAAADKARAGDSFSWGSMLQPLGWGLLLLLAVIILGSFMGGSRRPVSVHRIAPAKRASPPAVQLNQAPSFADPPQLPSLPSVGKGADDDWPAGDGEEDALDENEAAAAEDFQRQEEEQEDANESSEARKEALEALEDAAGIEGFGEEEQDIAQLGEDEQDAAKRLVNKYKDEEDDFGVGDEDQGWFNKGDSQGGGGMAFEEGDQNAFERIKHKYRDKDSFDIDGEGGGGADQYDGGDKDWRQPAQGDGQADEEISLEDQEACEQEGDFEACIQRKQAEHRLLPKADDSGDSNWFHDSLNYVAGMFDEDDGQTRDDMTEEQAEAADHLHHIKPLDDDFDGDFDDFQGGIDGGEGQYQGDGGQQADRPAFECDPEDEECFHRQSEERLKPHALPELNEVQDSNWFADSFDYVNSLFDYDQEDSKPKDRPLDRLKAYRVPDDFGGQEGDGQDGAQDNSWRENAQHLLQNRQQQVLDKMAMDMTAADEEIPAPELPKPMLETADGLDLGRAKPVNPFVDQDGANGAEDGSEGAEPAGPGDNTGFGDDEAPQLIKRPEDEDEEQDDNGW